MKNIIIIFFLLITQIAYTQDMSGEWNGVLTQEQGDIATSYYFQLNLKQKGTIITGTSKVSFIDKPQFYAIMNLKGSFKNDILLLEEVSIKDENKFEKLEWCIKKIKLNFTFKKDGFCIEGTWSGKGINNQICIPGTIKMCKIVPIAQNKVNNIEVIDKQLLTER